MAWNLNRVIVLLGALAQVVALGIFLGPAGSPPEQATPLFLGPLAALVLAFFAPAWMYLVAGVLLAAFPLVILFVFGAFEALKHPGSGLESGALMLLLLGAILGLLGGIVGFVQARRGTAPAPGRFSAPQGHATTAIAALFAGLMLSSAMASADLRDLAERPASHVEPEETIQVTTDGLRFAPRHINVSANKLVALHITNGDAVVHTMSYKVDGELRQSVIPAKGFTDILLRISTPQTIHFWCAPHSQGEGDRSDQSMWGEIVVQ